MEISRFLDYATLFFLQYIPNGLIYILAGYTFSAKVIDKKKYFFSSGILAVFGFTAKLISEAKLFNTSNTIPQILILFVCIFLLVNINKIKMVTAIISSLIVMILQLFFEGIYIFLILKSLLGINIERIFNESLFIASIIGLPYLITLGLFILIIYVVIKKRRINGDYAR